MTEELRVGIHYQGHQLSVPAGLFMHLLNCASNHLHEIDMNLKEEPLDWEDALIDVLFANRKASLQVTWDTIEMARAIREFLKENAAPCR
jgi:hypothetical protein